MADAGLDDILLSYPLIGPAKALRLAALARRATMSVAVDNPLALDTAALAARAARSPIGVLVEFDSGNKRTGVVSVDQALNSCPARHGSGGIRVRGFDDVPEHGGDSGLRGRSEAPLHSRGHPPPGRVRRGTPNAWHAHEVAGLTEVRVGTYIYHDRATVAAGTASLDECALHLWATIVSRPTEDRAIMDAGTKSLTSDQVAKSAGPGYGLVLGYPDAVIERLNEEHGIIDISRCAKKPELGEGIRIVPNHVCVVSNLHDEVVVSRDGQVVDTWRVAARGKTR